MSEMRDGMRESSDLAVRIATSSPSSGAASVRTPFAAVLRSALDSAAKAGATRTVFEVVPPHQPHGIPQSFLLWVTHVPEASSLSLESVQERCARFLALPDAHPESSCISLLQEDERGWDDEKHSLRSALVVLTKVQDAILLGASLSDHGEPKPGENPNPIHPSAIAAHADALLSWIRLRVRWPQWHSYEAVAPTTTESRSPRRRRYVAVTASIAILALLLLLSIILVLRARPAPIYDRYDTSGSEGPRHQLRLYWQNATAWAAANPQDDDKWRVRIDDQAIIPAALYDADEERYQAWYRARYPEMQRVIDERDYVRASWMGSLQMKVPWDDQFHFAHCVLALRRYWKAKETGRHVCGRDIDYLHIDHCLGALEKRVFVDGPRVQTDPQWYMYWQTKVCF